LAWAAPLAELSLGQPPSPAVAVAMPPMARTAAIRSADAEMRTMLRVRMDLNTWLLT